MQFIVEIQKYFNFLKQIMLTKMLKELIKCHHYEITAFIINTNFIKAMKNGDNNDYAINIKYMNFAYFSDHLSSPITFYFLCKFNFVAIVQIILENSELLNKNNEIYQFF